jgi:Domain of unknown function (DUF4328)
VAVRRRPSPRFVPPGRLARGVVVALGANAALAWIVVVGLYTFLERVWRGLGGRFTGQTLESHWAQVEAARRVHGVVWVVTAVLFLAWLRRVYGNVVMAGSARIRLSPWAIVGTFLLPGVNLVWPFLVLRELWSASDFNARAGFEPRPTPPWLVWWWGLFVIATVLDPGFWRLLEDTPSRFGVGGSTGLLIVAQLAEIAAAVLGIIVVRRISQRQEESWAAAEV